MDNGGSAFPQHGWSSSPAIQEQMAKQGGMSLRDYFAGQALAAIISKSPHEYHADVFEHREKAQSIAGGAYLYADAMLAERERAK